MTQLVTTTVQPNATLQTGVGTTVGAATPHAALSDGLTSTYVQVPNQYVRNETDRVRVGFPTPTIPAGAKVVSVSLRDRVQSATVDPPTSWGWVGCRTTDSAAGGSSEQYWREMFSQQLPVETTSSWVDRNPGGLQDKAPNGQPWDSANLATLFYEIGRGDAGTTLFRVAGVWLDVTYQRQSTVTVTGPTSPNAFTRPTVTWTFSSPDQQPQDAYRVAVYTAAQVAAPGFSAFDTAPLQASGARAGTADDSYWTSGPASAWTLPNDLVDGSYQAFVQARALWSGQGEFPTVAASIAWTRSATAGSPPPSAVLTDARYNSTLGLVEIDVHAGGDGSLTSSVTIEAMRDGFLYYPIPSATRRATSGTTTLTLWDTVADLNAPTTYRAIALNGTTAALAPSNTLTITPVDDRHWLVDPANPLLSTPFLIKAPEGGGQGLEVIKPRLESLYYEVGALDGVLLSPPKRIRGVHYGDEYKITMQFSRGETSASFWDKIEQIDLQSDTLLWKRPGEFGTGGTSMWVFMGIGKDAEDPKLDFDQVAGNPRATAWRNWHVRLTQAPPTVDY